MHLLQGPPFHLCIHLFIYFPYLELQSLHPLSHRFVLWGGGVGQLELEQVVASWCVAVLVEHDGGAGAACGGGGWWEGESGGGRGEGGEKAGEGRRDAGGYDAGAGTSPNSGAERELLTPCFVFSSFFPLYVRRRALFILDSLLKNLADAATLHR